MHTPNEQESTQQTKPTKPDEWFIDMPDLSEEEMEAELMRWWSGRELA